MHHLAEEYLKSVGVVSDACCSAACKSPMTSGQCLHMAPTLLRPALARIVAAATDWPWIGPGITTDTLPHTPAKNSPRKKRSNSLSDAQLKVDNRQDTSDPFNMQWLRDMHGVRLTLHGRWFAIWCRVWCNFFWFKFSNIHIFEKIDWITRMYDYPV